MANTRNVKYNITFLKISLDEDHVATVTSHVIQMCQDEHVELWRVGALSCLYLFVCFLCVCVFVSLLIYSFMYLFRLFSFMYFTFYFLCIYFLCTCWLIYLFIYFFKIKVIIISNILYHYLCYILVRWMYYKQFNYNFLRHIIIKITKLMVLWIAYDDKCRRGKNKTLMMVINAFRSYVYIRIT